MPQRAGAARAGVTRNLAVLVALALVEAVTWICLMPPLQGPDEVGHFAYTQKIVEAGQIPWDGVGGAPERGTRPVSSEVELALTATGIMQTWGNPSARPAATALDERIWSRESRGLTDAQRADGGFTPAMRNPPAYYLYEAVPYALTSWAPVFDRAFLMRLANLPLLVILVVFTWLVAGELLGRTRWLQVVATGAVVLQPQVIHMSAIVNPDIALAAIWAAALHLMIRTIKSGPSRARLLWLASLVVLSALTQPRGIALVIPAVAAVVFAAWRHGSGRVVDGRRRDWVVLATAYLGGALLLLGYAMRWDPSLSRARQLASYLWQFYLPRLGFMDPSLSPGWGVRQAFVDRLFGGFAQLEVAPPHSVLSVVAVAAVVILALALAGVAARWRAVARWPDVAIVCGLTIAGYVLLLHAVAFRGLLTTPDPVITGRYLLPLMPLYGTAVALAVAWLPRRAAVSVAVAVLVGLTFLQLDAFALLYQRFYA